MPLVYHIDGRPLADLPEAELLEWTARKRAERAMREAGSGSAKKTKTPKGPSATEVAKAEAEEM